MPITFTVFLRHARGLVRGGSVLFWGDDDDDDVFIKLPGLPNRVMLCGYKNRSSAVQYAARCVALTCFLVTLLP